MSLSTANAPPGVGVPSAQVPGPSLEARATSGPLAALFHWGRQREGAPPPGPRGTAVLALLSAAPTSLPGPGQRGHGCSPTASRGDLGTQCAAEGPASAQPVVTSLGPRAWMMGGEVEAARAE